ncbi:MAG: NADH-quinone oxidoreductase subunit N [Candidatus Saccharimonadaceae bacterium]
METIDLFSLMPQIILATGAIVLLLSIAVRRNHLFTTVTAILFVSASFISLFFNPDRNEISGIFIRDEFSIFFSGLILIITVYIMLISHLYMESRAEDIEEYYILMILATLGSTVLVSSRHFITFFLGLELLSTSLYVLIAFLRDREYSIEAGIKYLIIAAVSSSFLLFGMALIYSSSGSMYFPDLVSYFRSTSLNIIALAGIAFMMGGIGFKLALAPFHLWTPDVYEGAPAPVSAFIATISKAGVFAFFLRFIFESEILKVDSVFVLITTISILSMMIGNLMALKERNVKKILAYSSISHLGYLLIALLSGDKVGVQAFEFYLVVYMVTITGAFAIVSFLSEVDGDASSLNHYRGLFWTRPGIAIAFTVMLFSLAGIPLTAGFMSKFYLLLVGIGKELWLLSIVLVLTSIIGLFYYLRIIVVMFSKAKAPIIASRVGILYGLVFTSITLILLGVGIYPEFLTRLINYFSN